MTTEPPTADQVAEAFHAAEKARSTADDLTLEYRTLLRAALAAKTTTQAELSRKLPRSREALRLDANEQARAGRIARRSQAAG